jgi:hypothetical protein
MELRLSARRPRWWEKKWKPKKPILYILEMVEGKWVNTYWWSGNYRVKGKIKFINSGTVKIHSFFGARSNNHFWLVVGKSGTTLTVEGLIENTSMRSLNPMISEWTCFGKISELGIFTAEVSKFDLTEEIKKSLG